MIKAITRPDKRTRILEAAGDLFRDSHHVRKVSIEEIAARANVSPTTIYNYFGTREALVGEVARTLVRVIIERARELMRSSLPFPQKLQAIIAGKIDLTSKASDEVIAKLVGQDEAMARFVEELYRSEQTPLWHDFLAEGKAQGYVVPDLDEEAFLVYLDVLRAGFAARKDLLADWRNNMPLLEKLSRLVFFGFLKKDIDLFPKEAR